jgi:hypothetical protein
MELLATAERDRAVRARQHADAEREHCHRLLAALKAAGARQDPPALAGPVSPQGGVPVLVLLRPGCRYEYQEQQSRSGRDGQPGHCRGTGAGKAHLSSPASSEFTAIASTALVILRDHAGPRSRFGAGR